MKKQNNTYNIYYDEESDFLEIFIGDPKECYTEEIEPGIFVRKEEKSSQINSIGILSFKNRAQMLNDILKKIDLKLPINID